MRRRGPPWILLTVYKCKARIRDFVAAVFVDCRQVGRRSDVECEIADGGAVRDVDGAGDEGQLGGGSAGAGLEVAPLGAVLVGPRTPGLGDVALCVGAGLVD